MKRVSLLGVFTLFLAVFVMFFFAVPAVASADEITLYLEGERLHLAEEPFIQEGRTLVPMRAFFKALGAEVSWEHDTRIAIGVRNDITVYIPIGSIHPTVNGEKAFIDVPAQIVNERTYIPLRFVGQSLGDDVRWDEETRSIYITLGDGKPKFDLAPTKVLPYEKFDLAIESDYRELEVEFEQKRFGAYYAEVESEVDDEIEIELEGSAALYYLLPILEKLEINASMPKKEIVDRVLKAFDWKWPYEEFEIEVRFADGSYIDFEWESAMTYIETKEPVQATMLSASEARQMVISRFGGIIQKIEYAYDDTNPMYKGEALKAGYKVVFEINARTKNWVKWDTSKEDSWDDFAHALPNIITMDQAADSVIGKSGHSGTFIQKIDFLWDDSEPLYQGEAYRKGIKYSFEIYAYGGNYQKWDIDSDDDTWEEKYYNVR